MNYYESDILNSLFKTPFVNQKLLSEVSGHSVGVVNRSLKSLTEQGYLNPDMTLSEKAFREIREKAPKRAIILAAGLGMRMVPINVETPKALIRVNGEVLIERQINQLHEAGIREIYVVVGFMKEAFEYLMDEFGVELIVNPQYARKNNLHSLRLAQKHLENAYIIPSDIWADCNPFSCNELYSWYMVSDLVDNDSTVRVNRKNELVPVGREAGNAMVGIAYLEGKVSALVRERLCRMDDDPAYRSAFWEETLYDKDRMILSPKVVHSADVMEINTYEQLRELDWDSDNLKSDVIGLIAGVLSAKPEEIEEITVLKKGMTNRSFLFSCRGKRYIMRIPGEGTDRLVNRRNEAAVYEAIRERSLCDRVVYVNPENGFKITEFIENARICDPENPCEVKKAMAFLRAFHEQGLKVGHTFDIFGQINFYESLRGQTPSAFRDYERTKEKVLSLKPYIASHAKPFVLTHIDAVPDNFLFVPGEKGEEIRLIDWEYAGMQDPDVDIAMFIIYSLYDREQAEALIDAYYPDGLARETRRKIYCYIAACGLLWSNWCEYKSALGVEFGEYALRQYRYAKDYCKIVEEEA